MTIWEAIVLGAVQGLTEFLPVSSSGHEVLASEWLGYHLDEAAIVPWEVVVHLASAMAICLFLIWDLKNLPFGAARKQPEGVAVPVEPENAPTSPPDVRRTFFMRWAQYLVLATIPAGLAYLFLKDGIESIFHSPMLVAVALLFNGTLLVVIDRLKPNGELRLHRAAPLSGQGMKILAVGVAQAMALVPGLSRSGLTISTGLWAGLDRAEAVRFSFYLGLVAILAATVVKFDEIGTLTATLGWGPIIAGFTASFICSLASLSLLFALVRGMRLWMFGVYCLLAGIATLVRAGLM